jgi:lipopolysaccharide heptosyltransferase II
MTEAMPLLVVAPNWLGDAVMALPALADLKRHFADRRLAVAARASVSSLFTMVPTIDHVLKQDVSAIREVQPSMAVLFPNSFAGAWLVWRAQVPERWGYATDLRTRLLTRAVRRPKPPMHQGAYYQHLVRELGIVTGPLEPLIAIPADAIEDARRLLARHRWDGHSSLIVLAPGAAYGKAKQWIPSHVVRLVTDLVHARGITCALVGSRGDSATTRAIRGAAPKDCQPRILDLAGATTLPVLAAVISLAAACVSNDSGAMHLAAATGVPVIGIFGSTNEQATSPLAHSGVPMEVLTHPVWCRPCMLRECPIDHRCMTGIEPARVLAAVDRVVKVTA